MTTLKFIDANNANTTVGSAVGIGDATITVAPGTGGVFPTPTPGAEQVAVTLVAAGNTLGTPNEVVYVTGISGDVLTVTRAREGTTAQAWPVGATVANLWTSGQVAALAQQVDVQKQAGNYANDSGTANAGVVTLNPVPANLAALTGVPIRVLKIASANTGAYTLAVNGFTATAVLYQGTAPLAGDLLASRVFEVVYNGGNFDLQSPSGTTHGSPPTGAAGGDLTGTYPNPSLASGSVDTDEVVDGSLTNAKLANMPAHTFKANNTAGPASPLDLVASQMLTVLGLIGFVTGVNGLPAYVEFPTTIGGVLTTFVLQMMTLGSVTAGSITTATFPQAMTAALLAIPITESDGGSTDNSSAQIVSGTLTGTSVHVKLQNVTGAGSAPNQVVDVIVIGIL